MSSVLYIVSKPPHNWPDYKFILTPQPDDGYKTVVFVENSVIDEEVSAEQVFRIHENEYNILDKNNKSLPSISYRELLDLIFDSDHSVVV